MSLISTPIPGLVGWHWPAFADHRGRFARLFEPDWPFWSQRPVAQINQSRTEAVGALRGLHYQLPPAADAKLVRCLQGEVFDVAVDLRCGSSTFLHWFGMRLSPGRANALFLPEGFAHGFQVLEGPAELLYVHSAPYARACEAALRWDDPGLGIVWPLPVASISERDAAHPLLTPAFAGVEIV